MSQQEQPSVRDFFAIHAPECTEIHLRAQQLRDRNNNPHNEQNTGKPRLRSELEIQVEWRWEFADQMMKERDKWLAKDNKN